MKKNQKGESIDNTITYWMENDLKQIKALYSSLERCQQYHNENNTGIKLDINIFDYQEIKYINKEVKGY